jgi:tetratricopeptide (TPR) repeat protein
MQRRFWAASLVVVAGLSLSLVGCGEMNKLKARKAFKEATQFYVQQDYKRAADKFKETVEFDPQYATAYFYLANSYDNLYKATKRGDPDNDAYLTKAIQYYEEAMAKDQDPKQRKLAERFLLNAYGPDKLNDPEQMQPLLLKMLQEDPSDVNNYFSLAKLYEDSGQYEQAEQWLNKAREVNPKDPLVYQQLAGFWDRQGDFDKTMDAYKQWEQVEPNNPEVYYTLASRYWDKAYRDKRLKEPEKRQLAEQGMQDIDKALQIKPDYIDALVRKGLLIRLQAGWEKDRAKYDALMKEAQTYTDKATALQKKKAAGLGN